jgi:hypothetical protein
MATSTSPEPGPDAPRVEQLTTIAEQSVAIDLLVGLAKRHVRVFDYDLSQTGWNDGGRMERITTFLREVRGRRLDIIVHDTRYIESACPRLLRLLQGYGHAISILRIGDEARVATDPLVIVDTSHYLHRFHFEQPRAALGIAQPDQAQLLAKRFDEIWATGEPGVSPTVLGL